MQLAHPLADEHINGYFGRLRALNFHINTNQTENALAIHFSSDLNEQDGESIAILASLAAKQSTKAFIQNHTLIPFRQSSIIPVKSNGCDNASDMVARRASLRMLRPGAYLCLNCIEEDLAQRGFSYWRRVHQLPGIDWCPDHKTSLYIVRSKSAFTSLPHHLIDQSKQAVFDTEPVPLADSPVWRYANIARGLLNSTGSTSSRIASIKLFKQAKMVGIRSSIKGRRPTLADQSVNSCPSQWLERLFPGVTQSTRGTLFGPIDNALRLSGTPSACTLALAVMFDCPNQAIEHWREVAVDGSKETKYKGRGFDFWHSKDVFKKYVATKGNHQAVADYVGLARQNVNAHMMRAGLPALGNLTRAQSQSLLAFFEGKTLIEACATYEVEIEHVEQYLRISSARLHTVIKAIGEIPLQLEPKRNRRGG